MIAPLPSYGASRDAGAATRHQALIMTPPGTHDVLLTGGGTIDGAGSFWWHKKKVEDARRGRNNTSTSTSTSTSYIGRPRLFESYNSTNIELSHLTFKNSGFWTIHPV